MFTDIPNVCRWWQFHNWTVWQSADGCATNKFTGAERSALVQSRHCMKCGYSQIEGVRGR